MQLDVGVYLLSSRFMKDYPSEQYPELMAKQGRPYSCLLIETHYDYFICIPFRSDIRHANAFLFSSTKRSQKSHSGLDYSKIVIVQNSDYIDSESTAIVDADEYTEMMQHIHKIAAEALAYVESYTAHMSGLQRMHEREFSRKYRYATLKYFHNLLCCKSSDAIEQEKAVAEPGEGKDW